MLTERCAVRSQGRRGMIVRMRDFHVRGYHVTGSRCPVLRFGSPLPSEKLGPGSVTHSAPPSHGTHTPFDPFVVPPHPGRVWAAQRSIAGRKGTICTASAQRLTMVRRRVGWLQHGLCAGFFRSFVVLAVFSCFFLFFSYFLVLRYCNVSHLINSAVILHFCYCY
ncbi:hypothetical protein BZL39_G03000 [Zygosaccharomyces parabailii]|nr:hypothetical protein BZL39_G03000 [Zygosaccharomyces parabailii]